MSKLIKILFFFWGTGLWSYGQTVSGNIKVARPYAWSSEYPDVSWDAKRDVIPKERDQSVGFRKAWIVYGDKDRVEAKSSADPNSSGNGNFIEFKKPYIVFEENGRRLKLISYEPESIEGAKGVITTPIKVVGWVDQSDVLLWQKALAKNKILVKVLTVNSIGSLKNAQNGKLSDIEKLTLYNSPDCQKRLEEGFGLFQFLYVFKKLFNGSDTVCMLGTSDRISPEMAETRILGWAKMDQLESWPSRVCLEPNTDPSAVEERKAKGIKISFFETSQDSRIFASGGQPNGRNLNKEESFEKPLDGQTIRNPIFSDNKGAIQTGFKTGIYGLAGSNISKDTYDEILDAVEDVKIKRRNVNVVFCIDGSGVMAKYKDNIIQGVLRGLSFFKEEEDNNTRYNLGMVIYRDIAEANGPKGDISLEQKSLSNDPQVAMDWLRKKPFENILDKDPSYQAVFSGLNAATRMFVGKEKESNYIVLIGAGGNIETNQDDEISKLAKTFQKNNISLYGFQVFNQGGAGYQYFQKQCGKIIKGYISESNAYVNKTLGENNPPPSLESLGKNEYGVSMSCSNPKPAFYVTVTPEAPFSPDVLELKLNAMIADIQKGIDLYVKCLEKAIMGDDDNSSALAEILKAKGINWKAFASNKKFQLFVKSYTIKKSTQLTNPFFNECLFMSNLELTGLIDLLNRLNDAAQGGSEQRSRLVGAYKKILAAIIGEKEAKLKMKTISPQEILNLLFGIPIKSDFLNGVKRISDLENPSIFTDTQLTKMLSIISQKTDCLTRVMAEDKNRCEYTQNEGTYYWVPISCIP